MRILTIAFFDDNFGDMLIRTCFIQLTKVALQNLGVRDYTLDAIPLKSLDDQQVESAELIVFPGGAMFGINYLGVADDIEHVLDIADARGIPVVFSSLGLNHMESGEEHDARLHQMLSRPCIKAVSVRDSDDAFRRFAGEQTYSIRSVCDPAVWVGAVYAKDTEAILEKKRTAHTPVVGLNVVRGGLFKANGVDWTMGKEGEYLLALTRLLDEQGVDYRFFTNGSTGDINTMKHFGEKYRIPPEKLIFTYTAREVVRAEAGFDAVVAIRMHAAIIAYALGVPSVNYVWNPKIPDLYRKIGYPERAVMPRDWSAEKAAEFTGTLLAEKAYSPEPAVQMTLYRFLYETYRAVIGVSDAAPMYDYPSVRSCLCAMTVPPEEDVTDLRTKLKRGEDRYYALFKTDNRRKSKIKTLEKETEKLRKANDALQKQLEEEKAAREKAEKDREKEENNRKKAEKNRKKAEKDRDAAQKELDRLNNKFIIRAYRKLRGTSKPHKPKSN